MSAAETINAIRFLSIDAIEKAKSGHPGLPMGAAPMAYTLFQKHLKFDPQNPEWRDRDRFVLSAGHGSMLIYSLLHLYGYDLTIDDIKDFRQFGSKTPGHPEFRHAPGVEATTGPLGQGSANAVGMAMAERRLASLFNRDGNTLVDHMTYAFVSDGDLMEGISAEAASLAGHLKLGKLVYLYDANDISLDGPTSLAFTEDVGKRYESYGWHVQTITDGDNDLEGLDRALTQAKTETERPSLIVVKTTIGFGSPNKSGSAASHGSPLGSDEATATRDALGWKYGSFEVPDAVYRHTEEAAARGKEAREAWLKREADYQQADGKTYAAWEHAWKEGPLELNLKTEFKAGQSLATRKASGTIIQEAATQHPTLFGGDADLSCSTNTSIKDGDSFDGASGAGRNVHYGVREHAMGAIANGICYHGGLRPFNATFFVFSDYMRPAVRLAAMNKLPTISIWTHDSIGLGEDGPTHQPIEHLASLRAMPNLHVMRPADALETAEMWKLALKRHDGPSGLVLTRQSLPVLSDHASAISDGAGKGGYVLADSDNARVILLATGSEVHLALSARDALEAKGVATRVVSMPCWEEFQSQDAGYQESVLPKNIAARVAIEAGVSQGWERFVGIDGATVTMSSFGASAPAPALFEHFGFTTERVVSAAERVLAA